MIVKILPFLFLLFPLIMIFNILRERFLFKGKIKRLDDFHEFHKRLIGWIDEVKNEDIREELLVYCLNLMPISGDNVDFNLEKETKLVNEKYGKYIPSLMVENRDKKIDEILK